MPALRESTTAVLVRAETIAEGHTTEPYEAAWANQAVVFVHSLDDGDGGTLAVQISPDGMNWVDDGTEIALPGKDKVAFGRISHFGNWLRFAARLPDGSQRRLTVTLQLKG